ncbi:MAG: ABC transporter ATP-binding protein [Propionibacteriaceae bacterium]|nr:ABC transporter ATP-binding protein [Propionibacteriaceae bacterium]
MSDHVLALTGVNAWYGHAQALFGLDLTVDAGQIVALMGRNGAGKTTTLRSVMGIEVRRSGSVRLAGQPIEGLGVEAIARRGVGWVPDDRRIFPTLTVRENLQLVRGIAKRQGRQPMSVAELVEVLPIMERLIERKGHALSGGEQQAVTIARALVGRPQVLLLDEPTEGLAPVIVQGLAQSIAALPKRHGVSILLAEQNLGFVRDVAERVYVLDIGRLVFAGDTAEFMTSPELQERYLAVARPSGVDQGSPGHGGVGHA